VEAGHGSLGGCWQYCRAGSGVQLCAAASAASAATIAASYRRRLTGAVMNDDFDALDRLVEFGLGAAVARQMAGSMNVALRRQAAQIEAGKQSAAGVWVAFDGQRAGPFDEAELRKLITDGRVTKSTQVWRPGMAQWQTVENTPEVLRLVVLAPASNKT
jgi:hypothetical protein